MADYQRELNQIVAELNRASSRESTVKASTTAAALSELLELAVQQDASDILLVSGAPAALRRRGKMSVLPGAGLTDADIQRLVLPLLTPGEYGTLQKEKSVDLAFDSGSTGRFRANVHYQRGTLACCIRLLPRTIPTLEDLHLPDTLDRLANLRQGLVLVTGPTGCGKTSTLAALVDRINDRRECHIVTIEEPVEYVHANRSAIIEQIEVGRDTPAFLNSLRSILRQSPDVILIGEMRDPETIATALTAAETGHLVLSTLHTNDTAQAVSRILDVFPTSHQSQIRLQLSLALSAVIAQQLVPSVDGKSRYPALEIMMATDAVRNLIRQGQDQQLRSQLTIGRAAGMNTMEQSLAELTRSGRISREVALSHGYRVDDLRGLLAV
ncbi:MAG: PilT/PilU family type 4a pilus ATPase [Acidobacteria bacterium]|nr:PilT/PilU family type 4a pilus ATPase [Acidobacteriota bacterium]